MTSNVKESKINDESEKLAHIFASFGNSSIEEVKKESKINGESEKLANIFASFGNLSIEEVKKELNKLTHTSVNIAFVGETKSGKSTVINSLMELYPNDPGAAAVDVEVCTAKPSAYVHPNFPNITFWDIPGVNVPGYTMQNYLEEIKKVEITEKGM